MAILVVFVILFGWELSGIGICQKPWGDLNNWSIRWGLEWICKQRLVAGCCCFSFQYLATQKWWKVKINLGSPSLTMSSSWWSLSLGGVNQCIFTMLDHPTWCLPWFLPIPIPTKSIPFRSISGRHVRHRWIMEIQFGSPWFFREHKEGEQFIPVLFGCFQK